MAWKFGKAVFFSLSALPPGKVACYCQPAWNLEYRQASKQASDRKDLDTARHQADFTIVFSWIAGKDSLNPVKHKMICTAFIYSRVDLGNFILRI